MRITGEVHSMESSLSLDQFVAYFDSHQAVLLQINWQLYASILQSSRYLAGSHSSTRVTWN